MAAALSSVPTPTPSPTPSPIPVFLTAEEKAFQTKLNAERDKLARGGEWGKSWNYLKNLYPNIPNETLDQLLNKEKYYIQSKKPTNTELDYESL